MKVFVKEINELDCACDALILPLLEGEKLGPYNDINQSLNGLLSKIITTEEFRAKHNEVSLIHTYEKIKPARIVAIGLGKRNEVTNDKLRQAGGKVASYIKNLGLKDIAVSTKTISMLKLKPADFIEGSLLSQYSFSAYKKEEVQKEIKTITVLSKEYLKEQIKWIEVAVNATHFARDLVNTPANDMTPTNLVKAALSLRKVSVKVIEKNEADKLGMGAYISVTKGSMEPPKFIVIRYKGKNITPISLIGKAVTFDSGGLSLKSSKGMEKMKSDMAGGAAVLGVMKAASEMNLPLNLIGILPATENLPGGYPSKPGDVVRTVEGKTIEIVNTDAEGRLTLVDAICYVKRFKPSAIVDIATLTGACSIALGEEAIAMMGNDESLLNKMKIASEETSERVWQMPLFSEYKDYIKSDIADLKNCSGRSGSLVTAGYFLKEFAGNTPWLHLDIASTAWTDKDKPYIPKGATGVGVRLLLSFLKKL